MYFYDVVGHESLKSKLVSNVRNNRISHAQLFHGPEGSGNLALAVAFARFILCTDPADNDACGICRSCKKMDGLVHPDLHFFFPTYRTKSDSGEAKKEKTGRPFFDQWRAMLLETAYPSYGQWLERIGVQNQQAMIYAADCNEIIKSTAMKPFEGSHKVVIVWMIEKLRAHDASRLLKTLEEPPEQTVFLLVSENKDEIVKTVLSRTQLVNIPFLKDQEIAKFLMGKYDFTEEKAIQTAFLSGGSFIETLRMMEGDHDPMAEFEDFRNWMRLCFDKRKTMLELLKWVDTFAKEGRERQKAMLGRGLVIVRKCVLHNYNASKALRVDNEIMNFIAKFSPFVNHANTIEMVQKLNDAIYHIERNANAKLVFTELSFAMANLLKKKP